MQFSMLYSGEQILSFKLYLAFYAGDSLKHWLTQDSTQMKIKYALVEISNEISDETFLIYTLVIYLICMLYFHDILVRSFLFTIFD